MMQLWKVTVHDACEAGWHATLIHAMTLLQIACHLLWLQTMMCLMMTSTDLRMHVVQPVQKECLPGC